MHQCIHTCVRLNVISVVDICVPVLLFDHRQRSRRIRCILEFQNNTRTTELLYLCTLQTSDARSPVIQLYVLKPSNQNSGKGVIYYYYDRSCSRSWMLISLVRNYQKNCWPHNTPASCSLCWSFPDAFNPNKSSQPPIDFPSINVFGTVLCPLNSWALAWICGSLKKKHPLAVHHLNQLAHQLTCHIQ